MTFRHSTRDVLQTYVAGADLGKTTCPTVARP